MLKVEAIPALFFFILTFFIPKSPRWLIIKSRAEKGLKILRGLGDYKANETFERIKGLENRDTKLLSVSKIPISTFVKESLIGVNSQS
jgi:hypothetical protein